MAIKIRDPISENRPVFIDRSEQFDKAKRNFVWFSAALALSAFAAERLENAQPLLGVAIAPHWLGLGLICAMVYTAVPFRILWHREKALNSRHGNASADELEVLAGKLKESWASVQKRIEEARDRTQHWLDANPQLPSPENEELKKQLSDVVNLSVLQTTALSASWAWDEWVDEKVQALLNVFKASNDGEGDPESPEWYFEVHSRALFANVPEEPGATMFERMKAAVDQATYEKLDQDYAAILQRAVGANDKFRSDMQAVAANIAHFAEAARTLAQLKDGLRTGEKVLHYGWDQVVPWSLAAISLVLALLAFGDEWHAAIMDPQCNVPFLRSAECAVGPVSGAEVQGGSIIES